MPQMKVGEKTIEVDDNGFIVDPDDWNMEVANVLAERSALGLLVEDHWKVIVFVREYYEKYKTATHAPGHQQADHVRRKETENLVPQRLSGVHVPDRRFAPTDRVSNARKLPSLGSIKIVLHEKTYATENFREIPFRQASDVVVANEKIGFVEVAYRNAAGLFVAGERA